MPTSTTRAHRLLRVCTAGVLLAGCAGAATTADADPTASAAGAVPAPPTTTPTDRATPTPDRSDASSEAHMISFAVEGGFTGQMRSLHVDPDGAALVEVSGRSARGRLDAARVDAIVAELDASGLFDRDRTFPAPEGADQQRFGITYDGATIVAYDATVPTELTAAVLLLEESLRDVQR